MIWYVFLAKLFILIINPNSDYEFWVLKISYKLWSILYSSVTESCTNMMIYF